MEIAKVFNCGRSQAVRIPKKYRFNSSEVHIRRNGNEIVLTPVSSDDALQSFLKMECFPDFKIERSSTQEPQSRELFG